MTALWCPSPHSSRTCNLQSCNASFVVTDWSECSAYCGLGVQYRSARCVNGFGMDLGLFQCGDAANLPTLSRQCQQRQCFALYYDVPRFGICVGTCSATQGDLLVYVPSPPPLWLRRHARARLSDFHVAVCGCTGSRTPTARARPVASSSASKLCSRTACVTLRDWCTRRMSWTATHSRALSRCAPPPHHHRLESQHTGARARVCRRW